MSAFNARDKLTLWRHTLDAHVIIADRRVISAHPMARAADRAALSNVCRLGATRMKVATMRDARPDSPGRLPATFEVPPLRRR